MSVQRQLVIAVGVWAALTLLGGCESGGAGWFAAPEDTSADVVPTVLVDGRVLDADAIRTRTAELAGGVVVEELALEHLLTHAFAEAGLELTDADIEAERSSLVDSLVADRSAHAADLIARVRSRRGLGPHRFDALLRRNAMLRKLVRDGIRVDEREIRLAHEMSVGQRLSLRLIVVPTQRLAADSAARINERANAVGLTQAFADEARRTSVHESAARGGEMGVVSPVDPALPEALRMVIRADQPGQLTPIVPIGGAYGFALIERTIDAQPDQELTAHRALEIRLEITKRKERLEMERLAERLVRESSIQVVDPALGWSFRTRIGDAE